MHKCFLLFFSFVLCCLSSSVYFFPVSLHSSLLHSSISCVPLKDIHERRAAMLERVWVCPAITLPFYASVFLLVLFPSDPVWMQTSSLFSLIGFICSLCVCLLKFNVDALLLVSLENYFESEQWTKVCDIFEIICFFPLSLSTVD